MRPMLLELQRSWPFLLLALVAGTTLFLWYAVVICRDLRNPPPMRVRPITSGICESCRCDMPEMLLKLLNSSWSKQKTNSDMFRFQLTTTCNGVSNAIVTQLNTPLGSKVTYDGEKKKSLKVTPKLFDTFVKESPFINKSFKTCSVVGNGGVLVNSSCGEEIDSAQFVIRCNLPPLDKGYKRDVGNKTNLVTSNPSILMDKFGSLMELRRPFVERLGTFGDSLVLFPTFSYGQNTAVSLRALYTVQDFRSPARPVFLNPEYLRNLARFWRTKGLKRRLSTGIMMVSLALELCDEVNLYGFWPYPQHPRDCRSLTNHYYDDVKSRRNVHAMPEEFNQLLQLYKLGVVKLHLEECVPTARKV
ncbi:alpha-2,8-sialyltransferase 8F-like [Brienomyrus brachyistius]|uniref:alpha-2,8-sialyltransferase 8F-like n=1 Tax=Brienomyrus brachyistius TaxID=42636 RepID=UPI0020B35CE5|nr:alpha-2,8-sialyltransferase 8F-like [Brienomyrus brachyistius]